MAMRMSRRYTSNALLMLQEPVWRHPLPQRLRSEMARLEVETRSLGLGGGPWFLVCPQIGQNRKGAAPHYCLMLGRSEPDSTTWCTFLGMRSGGHQTPPFPFPCLIFGLSSFCARAPECGVGDLLFLAPLNQVLTISVFLPGFPESYCANILVYPLVAKDVGLWYSLLLCSWLEESMASGAGLLCSLTAWERGFSGCRLLLFKLPNPFFACHAPCWGTSPAFLVLECVNLHYMWSNNLLQLLGLRVPCPHPQLHACGILPVEVLGVFFDSFFFFFLSELELFCSSWELFKIDSQVGLVLM